ncbi:MAG: hypothetical protein ACLTMW_07595 [Blautia hydrogenotrophica]
MWNLTGASVREKYGVNVEKMSETVSDNGMKPLEVAFTVPSSSYEKWRKLLKKCKKTKLEVDKFTKKIYYISICS